MGLLAKLKNGDTKLKSLRYGNDRPGGGDSGQPFIKSEIPEKRKNLGAIDGDGILRGGLLAPLNAKEDVKRLSKFFFNLKDPKGFLFIAKQNLLSRVAPKTIASYGAGYGGADDIAVINSIRSGIFNDGIYTPLSTLLQAGEGYIGGHLTKQGLDPTGKFEKARLRPYQEAIANLNHKDSEHTSKYSVPKYLDRKISRSEDLDEKLKNTLSEKEQKFATQKAYQPPTPPIKKWSLNLKGRSRAGVGIERNVSGDWALNKWYRQRRRDERKENRYSKQITKTKSKLSSNQIKLDELRQQKSDILSDPGSIYYTRLLKLWYQSGLDLTNPVVQDVPSSILTAYSGGPGSILGIGNTKIKFATTNDGKTPLRTGLNRVQDPNEFTSKALPTYQINRIFGPLATIPQEIKSVSRMYQGLFTNQYTPQQFFGTDHNYFQQDVLQPWLIKDLNKTNNFFDQKPDYTKLESVINRGGVQIPETKTSVIEFNTVPPLGATLEFSKQITQNFGNDLGGVVLDKSTGEGNTWISSYGANNDSPINTKSYNSGSFSELRLQNGDTPIRYEGVGFQPQLRLPSFTPVTNSYLNGQSLNENYFQIRNEYTDDKSKEVDRLDLVSKMNRYYGDMNFKSGDSRFTFKLSDVYNDRTNTSLPNQSHNSSGKGHTWRISPMPKFVKNDKFGWVNEFRNKQTSGPEYNLQLRDKIISNLYNSFYKDADEEKGFLHPSYKKTRLEETKLFKNRFPRVRHEYRVNTGEPGRFPGSNKRRLDKISGYPVYKSGAKNGFGRGKLNDFVHFRIGILDAKNIDEAWYCNFRSLITNMDDSFQGSWSSFKYMGRGESFKRYQGFERTINIGWKVVAFSQAEMFGMYEKLRLLAASLAPTYTDSGYMTGNLQLLTIGGYCHEQPGIISSLTYTIPEESSWELTIGTGGAVKDELPITVDVSMVFEPIYDFIPQFSTGNRFLTHNIPGVGKDLPDPSKAFVKNAQNNVNDATSDDDNTAVEFEEDDWIDPITQEVQDSYNNEGLDITKLMNLDNLVKDTDLESTRVVNTEATSVDNFFIDQTQTNNFSFDNNNSDITNPYGMQNINL